MTLDLPESVSVPKATDSNELVAFLMSVIRRLLKKIDELEKKIDRIHNSQRLMQMRFDQECYQSYPWHRLKTNAKVDQITAVFNTLCKDPTLKIAKACRMVWTERVGGYKDAASMAKYCRKIEIKRFVGR